MMVSFYFVRALTSISPCHTRATVVQCNSTMWSLRCKRHRDDHDFTENKYSSFQRQLNLYGFRKLVRGNEAGGYMHPLFERGKPEQLSQVRRGFFPEV